MNYWGNFRFRAGQWTHEHRSAIIKWTLIAVAVVFLIFLLLGGIASWEDRRLEREMQKWEQKYRDKDAEAKAHQAEADALKAEIVVKDAEAKEWAKRGAAAENALRNAKAKTITLKEEYETIRYLPVPDSVSCAELRTELAGLGYK